MRRILSPPILRAAIRSLLRYQIPLDWITVAYDRWSAGAAAESCRYGAEQPIALECHCRGCTERLLFLFFDGAEKLPARRMHLA